MTSPLCFLYLFFLTLIFNARDSFKIKFLRIVFLKEQERKKGTKNINKRNKDKNGKIFETKGEEKIIKI